MSALSVGSNVVIAAKQFNPSIINQLWLVRNGLLGEDDFGPGCVFSELLANVQSRDFNLLVLPEQLQFTPTVDPTEANALVTSKVGPLVRALPHTPYKALGINFFWHVLLENTDVKTLTRSLFCSEGRPIYRDFGAGDAQFGGYFSRDFHGFRLKLDVKPILLRVASLDTSESRIQFAFNYHLDLPDDGAADLIQGMIQKWDLARVEAEKTVLGVQEFIDGSR
jgi:hypothetical protein